MLCPEWRISHNVRDFHDDQMDAIYEAFHPITQERVGYLIYALYKKVAYISLVRAEENYRRCGVGKALVRALVAEYGWDRVDWGWLTDEGKALKRAIEREQCRGLGSGTV